MISVGMVERVVKMGNVLKSPSRASVVWLIEKKS
jgi:hypothetical protein